MTLDRQAPTMSSTPPDLEIIVPVWNEEQRIGATLLAITQHAATTGISVLVTVVDNGSVDRTTEVVDRLHHLSGPRVGVRVLGCSRQGKGAAVRRGVLASRARWVGFADADLATPPRSIDAVLARLRAGDPVVIGSRRIAGSRMAVEQPLGRRLGSWGFRLLTSRLTGVKDSQCGFKFFRADVASEIFSRSRVDGFAFDVELLAQARRLGHAVTEVPVEWSDQDGSSFRTLTDAPRVFREVSAVRRWARSASTADAAPPRRRIVLLNWRDASHPLAGGAELYCESVAREMAVMGHDVLLLTSRSPGAARRDVRDGYAVVRGGGTYGVYAHALAWLLLHRRSIDAVVDSQNGIPFFSPLVLSSSTPAVLLVHHVHQDQFSSYFGPAMARFGRWLEGPMSRVVYGRRAVAAVSPSTRTQIRRQLDLRGAISVIPCGMDQAVDTGRGERSAVPRIVVVGRLVPHKQYELLVSAMPAVRRLVPGAELHLVGDGPSREGLEGLAAAPGMATVVHGRLDDSSRDALLRSAWITASASSGEGWGLSVLEANAVGVPAVAYRVSGLQDSVRHGRTGWLVEPGSDLAPALTAALQEVAGAESSARYDAACRAWASHFSWPRTARLLDRALALEARRLQLGRSDRRLANDVTSVVDLPSHLLPAGWQSLQRSGDTWADSGVTVRGLLRGADESDVSTALARLSIDPLDPEVSVTLARPGDLLGEPESWRSGSAISLPFEARA